jgi:uncharacterized protein YkwD
MPQQRTRREPREPTERDLRQLEQRVHHLINEQRRRAKLPPLIWHEQVAHAARDHSKNMAERNFFRPSRPASGRYRQAAESLPHQVARLRGEHLYAVWLQQPRAGRRTRLDEQPRTPRQYPPRREFTHAGVGVYYRKRDEHYYLTQIFIRPPDGTKR